MTRRSLDADKLSIAALCLITCVGMIAMSSAFVAAAFADAPALRSCPTPAQTFATLVACEATLTAQAGALTAPATGTPAPTVRFVTATPGATRTATPTKVTGTEAPGCWVVGQGVRFKFSPCEFTVESVP